MKPEEWIITDISSIRKKIKEGVATPNERSYLDLLQWYVKLMNEKD